MPPSDLCSEWIAGIDEVGRGALFGPVVAAAVMLPSTAIQPLRQAGLTDSKLLRPSQRLMLDTQIRMLAVDYQIGVASAAEIDRLNILNASLLAMRRAVNRLQPQPLLCLVDGNQRIPQLQIAQETWVKGDQKSLVIAAASVVAKVWRDRLIVRLANRYPGYGLESHKGYGTAQHRQAIQTIGLSRQHRRSFAPCRCSEPSATTAANLSATSIEMG
jgi:ribonuclease HII